MRVLLTGHNGYIGSVMAPFLRHSGHHVTGLDVGYFSETEFLKNESSEDFARVDIRDVDTADVLKDFDAIIHLAALSNDTIGNLRPEWTTQINTVGTLRLAALAKKVGVRRFLFSSSCIMYGSSTLSDVEEDAALDPKTDYARSKVVAEEGLRRLAGNGFSPIFIRNGTVYGLSPRMRFDTVLNNFVGQAVATGKVVVFSNGEPWRPVVHVEDVCRTFLEFLHAPIELVHNQAFNNGADELNWRVIDLAKAAKDTVTGTEIEVRAEAGADQRTYRASFAKFRRTFPDFRFKWNPYTGALELAKAFSRLGLDRDTFESNDFTRLKWLKHLIVDGKLDDQLRWARVNVLAQAAAGRRGL